MFSSRLPASLTPSPLAAAMADNRQAGRIRADLTLSNPTVAGFSYPETLATAWSNASNLDYTPTSLGMTSARDAVAAAYVGELGVSVDRVVLTASTSEGYAFLFKLLCNAGDRVMAPAPSYPLLDHLAALDAVNLDRYALHDAGEWTIDLEDLEARLTPRTRAIVTVAPNNPTGSVPTPAEWTTLLDLCARYRLALIVDEVFAPYRLDGHQGSTGVPLPPSPPALTIRLNGLSKLVGLPQAKLAWMIVDGPAPLVRDAFDRLEVIADTYLSVSTPVQVALPTLLSDGQIVRDQIRARIVRNLDALVRSAPCGDAVSLRRPQGGWTAVLRTPGVASGADGLVRALLDEGVLTHPAYFYDFAHDDYLVVSLLTPPDEFDMGLDTLSEVLAAGLTS